MTLISRITEYSRRLFRNWQLSFALTSNGTLLNDQYVDFLARNNFALTVSVDGPQNVHDEKRIFPSGAGSFGVIFKKLERLQKKNPIYYKKKVRFNVVFSLELPFQDIYTFFCNSPLVMDNPVLIFPVVSLDTEYYRLYPYDHANMARDMRGIMNSVLGHLRRGEKVKPFEQALLSTSYAMRDRISQRDFNLLSGACLFNQKLFIDALGTFHICEKINNTFPIGNCYDGYNYERMASLTKDFMNLRKDRCSSCQYRFLCTKCYIFFAKRGYFDIDAEICNEIKENIRNSLETLGIFGPYLTQYET